MTSENTALLEIISPSSYYVGICFINKFYYQFLLNSGSKELEITMWYYTGYLYCITVFLETSKRYGSNANTEKYKAEVRYKLNVCMQKRSGTSKLDNIQPDFLHENLKCI